MDIQVVDLNLDNYSLDDIFKLFKITDISEESLKCAKKFVHKTHPDKSRLDPKFFQFYTSAYTRLYDIYKNQAKIAASGDETRQGLGMDKENKAILKKFLSQPAMKDPKNFNDWFNKSFDAHFKNSVDDGIGHGDWLKGNGGIVKTPIIQNPANAKSEMNAEFEKHKKRMQDVTVYTGIHDIWGSSSIGGSLLEGNQVDNFSSNGMLSGGLQYQDVKQAFEETLIPVTQDDFGKVRKFRTQNEYECFRDKEHMKLKPVSMEESEEILKLRQEQNNRDGIYAAYAYAQKMEENKRNEQEFWSKLRHIKNDI